MFPGSPNTVAIATDFAITKYVDQCISPRNSRPKSMFLLNQSKPSRTGPFADLHLAARGTRVALVFAKPNQSGILGIKENQQCRSIKDSMH
jgi:hypothetical protein